MDLTGFSITGLHGRFNVDAKIDGGCLILVGPNGTGKSTIINTLYFALTRQWARLLDLKFEQVNLKFGRDHVTIDRQQLADSKELSSTRVSGIRRRYIAPLVEADLLEKFISRDKFTTADRKAFSQILEMPDSELPKFREFLLRNVDELAMVKLDKIGSELARLYQLRTIFLPTYRRIEKELKSVIPDFEERYRARVNSDRLPGKRQAHFVELVSFGMEDVCQIFERVSRDLRDYARTQINTLSVTYLRTLYEGILGILEARSLRNLPRKRLMTR